MRVSGFGHALFGISVTGLAALSLVYGNFKPVLDPFPTVLPQPEIWAYGSAATLLAAGAGLFFGRTALASAMIVGAFELVWVATRSRALFFGPLNVGSLYGVCEALGPLLGAWVLCALLRRQHAPPSASAWTGGSALRAAQILFGLACITYGAAHFAYAAYTAAMVPHWLPSPKEFTYLTGACHAAAGLGLVVGVLPRLAATMEGVMMSLFGALVWLPSFAAHPRPDWASPSEVQWSETFLTFLLASSAFIVAASLRDTSQKSAPAERNTLS
jgi:uncharacterized membrane protein